MEEMKFKSLQRGDSVFQTIFTHSSTHFDIFHHAIVFSTAFHIDAQLFMSSKNDAKFSHTYHNFLSLDAVESHAASHAHLVIYIL